MGPADRTMMSAKGDLLDDDKSWKMFDLEDCPNSIEVRERIIRVF